LFIKRSFTIRKYCISL